MIVARGRGNRPKGAPPRSSLLTKDYGAPRQKAANGLRGLLNCRGVTNPDRVTLKDALALFGAGKPETVYCLVIAGARRNGGEPCSFDHDSLREFAGTAQGKKESS